MKSKLEVCQRRRSCFGGEIGGRMGSKESDQSYTGTFWINPDECVICGCCQHEAPGLIADAVGPDNLVASTIVRQPTSVSEYEQILSAVSVCMVDCIYYDGSDQRILEVFARAKAGLHADEIWPKSASLKNTETGSGTCCKSK